ncbi:MAG: hypothetical protein JSR28_01855 [Proteobacteria bacterium]|nr:hypothetical protein [Pseudomonadota bacterium]
MAGESELQKAVDKLIAREPGWKEFTKKAPLGAKPGATSTGRPASAGKGVQEFVEADATLREYYDWRSAVSSDGLWSIEYREPKKLVLIGGGSIQFDEPPTL